MPSCNLSWIGGPPHTRWTNRMRGRQDEKFTMRASYVKAAQGKGKERREGEDKKAVEIRSRQLDNVGTGEAGLRLILTVYSIFGQFEIWKRQRLSQFWMVLLQWSECVLDNYGKVFIGTNVNGQNTLMLLQWSRCFNILRKISYSYYVFIFSM